MSDEFVIAGKEDLAKALERIERTKQLTDLIEVIVFLRDRPDVPLPYNLSVKVYNIYLPSAVGKDEFVSLARKNGFTEKGGSGTFFTLAKQFGNLNLLLNIDREKVCEKIVKGTTWIPGYTVEGRSEEEVEWKCGLLLGDEKESSNADPS